MPPLPEPGGDGIQRTLITVDDEYSHVMRLVPSSHVSLQPAQGSSTYPDH